MISVALYLGSLVLVNLAYLQPWTWHTFPVVGAWSAGSILVGAVFVARDYAQRDVGGRRVLYAMAVGIALTAAMSGRLALASGLAFAVSEGLEAVIFAATRRPFRERVVWSAVPLERDRNEWRVACAVLGKKLAAVPTDHAKGDGEGGER